MILGIDQSLKATGLCLTTNELEIKAIMTLDTAEMHNFQRIGIIVKAVEDLYGRLLGMEQAIAVREGYSYQSRTNSAFQLGELGGCINQILASQLLAVMPLILPPTTVKLLTLGDGGIKKDSAYLMKVLKITGKEFADDNQADAFLLCKAGFLLYSIISSQDCTGIVAGLTVEQKNGLIPPVVRKRNKLTEAKVKKLTASELQKFVCQAMATVYGLS